MNAAAVKRLVAAIASAVRVPPGARTRPSGWTRPQGPRGPAAAIRALAAATVGLAGCGTNLQAAYEGDVRFEHCMALDARPAVRTEIRSACWGEWLSFYTYGQTRDRLVHAFRRLRELRDGSAPTDPTAELGDEPEAAGEGGAERNACVGECRAALDACADGCDNRACRTACTAGFRRCARACR